MERGKIQAKPFKEIVGALDIIPQHYRLSHNKHGKQKYVIVPDALHKKISKQFVVYGFGVDNHPDFEMEKATKTYEFGIMTPKLSVFAFD